MKIGDWSDRLNPVLVKEVRQYFHNWVFIALMGVLLGGQLLMLIGFGVSIMESTMASFVTRGKEMYTASLAILGGCGVLFCGVGTLLRFAKERRDRELDFSCITTLTPLQIIGGKLAGAVVMMIFLYALCLPFMVIAYFLRGISMGDMLLFALLLFLPLLICTQLGMLIGSAGKGWLAVFYVLLLFLGCWPILGMVALFQYSGFGNQEQMWLIVVSQVVGLLSFLGLLIVLTSAVIAAPASNRMLPVRTYLLLMLLLLPQWGWLALLIPGQSFDDVVAAVLIGWLGNALACVILISTLAAFERFFAGVRVTRRLPGNWRRWGMFLLSSGASGGIVLSWLILLLLMILPVAGYWWECSFFDHELHLVSLVLMAIAGYFIAYAELSIWLRLIFSKLPGWVSWLLVVATVMWLPLVVGSMAMVASFSREAGLFRMFLITTPFCLIGDLEPLPLLAWFGPVFALVLLIPLNRLLLKGIREFRKTREALHE